MQRASDASIAFVRLYAPPIPRLARLPGGTFLGGNTSAAGANADLLIGHDGQDNLNGQGGSPDTLVGNDAFDTLDDNAGSDLIDGAFVFAAEWIDAA